MSFLVNIIKAFYKLHNWWKIGIWECIAWGKGRTLKALSIYEMTDLMKSLLA